jgi:hypothetical protein
MAVYKVIQDVEAEDKLLGPLTLKGFVYALITAALGFINFKLITSPMPSVIKGIMALVLLLPMLLFGVLASPLGREQPTEVWLLSRLRFFMKPRLRRWDQAGLEELVTITVPKKLKEHLTKDLDQTEVRSRLKTLASTLDTRGWAIKNVDLNLNAPVPGEAAPVSSSDRLIASAGYSQAAQVVDVHAADDILDEQSNPTAQKFANLMQDADTKRKQQLQQTVQSLLGSDTEKSDKLSKRLSKAKASFAKSHKRKSHAKHKLLDKAEAAKAEKSKPPEVKAAPAPAKAPAPAPVTPARQAVNMELAQSGSAFSVATLSQLANRQPQIEQTGPNEVTISLH